MISSLRIGLAPDCRGRLRSLVAFGTSGLNVWDDTTATHPCIWDLRRLLLDLAYLPAKD